MSVRTFVFDLDGVMYRGKQPLPGAVQAVETLRRLGHQVYFFTNNSTRSRAQYVRRLADMGLDTDQEHVMTSGHATALYLKEHGAHGKSVYLIGEEGVRGELRGIGMRLAGEDLHEHVDYVVVGWDRTFNYEKLLRAQQAILNGAEFIATNRDPNVPLEDGLVFPGGGAMVAAIETAASLSPRVIGKPETYALHKILEMSGTRPEDTVIIGDRLQTDILAGRRLGAQTVLVLTGIATRQDAETAPPEMKPDLVIETLAEMELIYQEARK